MPGRPGTQRTPTATWTLSIEPADGGATLTHSAVLHAGKAPLAPAIEADPASGQAIVDDRMAKVLRNMTATVAGIATLAEAQARDAT